MFSRKQIVLFNLVIQTEIQRRDLAGVCFVMYLHQNPGIKEIVSHVRHYFKRAGMILSEYFIVSPNNIQPI